MTADESTGHRLFAALYDPVTKVAEDTLFEPHREYLAANLEGTVLDLGAGTGAMFPYFERIADDRPTVDLHAIEPDVYMRRRAERKASKLDLDIEIRPDGADSLSYPADTFDVVIASMVFCTIPDVEGALEAAGRVLKPGGELRILEHVQATGWVARLQDILNPVWRVGAAGCHLNRDTEATVRRNDHFDVAELEALNAGIPPVTPFIRGTLIARE